MIKNLILISLSVSFISCLAFGLNVQGIHLDNNIPVDQQNQIVKDINYLANLNGDIGVDKELLEILHLKKLSAKDLMSVLNFRVKYIVNEDWDYMKNVDSDDSKQVEYAEDRQNYALSESNPYFSLLFNNESKGSVAPIENKSSVTKQEKTESTSEESQTSIKVMNNISAGVYTFGKNISSLAFATMHDGTKIEATSNNVGLIQIGAGLFCEDIALKKNDLNAEVNIIARLKTYFHEGQHSLGNGEYLSLGHQLCPSGHPLEKQSACDSILNGSYSFEAYIGKALMKAAKNLSEKDKEMLRLEIADGFSSVVGITKERVAKYKAELISLKNEIKDLMKDPNENADDIRIAKDKINVIETMLKNPEKFTLRYVDDKPEEVKFLRK